MDSVSYSLGIVLAANLKNQGFSDLNSDELAQGFADSLSGNSKLTVEEADEKSENDDESSGSKSKRSKG